MPSTLPLDDAIGRTHYIGGGTWRLAYNREIRRFALKPIALDIPFGEALERIASGELLWQPPQRFDPLDRDLSVDTVQKHVALLGAFRRSPGCIEANDWQLVVRIDARLADCRAWLTRRALAAGESPEGAGE